MPKRKRDATPEPTPEPASSSMTAKQAGWYPEPRTLRWWDGDTWTSHVHPPTDNNEKVVLDRRELDKQIGEVGFTTMAVFMFTALLASIPAAIMAGFVVLFGLSLLGGAVG